MGDIIWQTAKADSHILKHVWGLSNQNPGRLMMELTAARMNLVLESVVITQVPSGGGGCVGMLLLQVGGVDHVEVGGQPVRVRCYNTGYKRMFITTGGIIPAIKGYL